jgi:hypothetical protein
MSDSRHRMTQYLLGDMSGDEQTAFEEQYFDDPRVFEQLAAAETQLVDDYVRGRLAPGARQRFEQVYLTDPRRCERVRFAEALADRVDRAETGAAAATQLPGTPRWRTWVESFRAPGPALALALASLLILFGGAWMVVESIRSRQEAARIETARLERERRARVLREESAARPARPPQPEPDSPADQPGASAKGIPPTRPAPSIVTFALAVGPGARSAGTGPPATLVIPPETDEVRLQLTLREHEYPAYRVIVRAVGGREILRRTDTRPGPSSSSARLGFTIPASRLAAGDYILTLQGPTEGGGFEDLSRSLFRVERK